MLSTWNKVGYDFKIIEYTTESFRSCQLQQLHSLMIDVDAESIARGDELTACKEFLQESSDYEWREKVE